MIYFVWKNRSLLIRDLNIVEKELENLNINNISIIVAFLIIFSLMYFHFGFLMSWIPYPTAWDANHAYMFYPKMWALNH
jgi:hypothetical protein